MVFETRQEAALGVRVLFPTDGLLTRNVLTARTRGEDGVELRWRVQSLLRRDRNWLGYSNEFSERLRVLGAVVSTPHYVSLNGIEWFDLRAEFPEARTWKCSRIRVYLQGVNVWVCDVSSTATSLPETEEIRRFFGSLTPLSSGAGEPT
jgi:hypothetical protein